MLHRCGGTQLDDALTHTHATSNLGALSVEAREFPAAGKHVTGQRTTNTSSSSAHPAHHQCPPPPVLDEGFVEPAGLCCVLNRRSVMSQFCLRCDTSHEYTAREVCMAQHGKARHQEEFLRAAYIDRNTCQCGESTTTGMPLRSTAAAWGGKRRTAAASRSSTACLPSQPETSNQGVTATG